MSEPRISAAYSAILRVLPVQEKYATKMPASFADEEGSDSWVFWLVWVFAAPVEGVKPAELA